jgi:uncharacterized protein
MKKISLIFFCFFMYVGFGQVPPKPKPDRLYNNLSTLQPNFLSTQQAAEIENKLQEFSKETSNQICIVITDSLLGLSDVEYATAIGHEWGVGKSEVNNGIVILIKPTGQKGKRKLFIAVGYGLEGAIPDLATKKIRELMYPYLKSGDNYGALTVATNDLMGLAKGEINVKDYTKNDMSNTQVIFIILVIIIFLYIMFKKGNRTYSSRGLASGFFLGGFGGGGSSSNDSGSSWSGFGGGDFGGGGSGGDW